MPWPSAKAPCEADVAVRVSSVSTGTDSNLSLVLYEPLQWRSYIFFFGERGWLYGGH